MSADPTPAQLRLLDAVDKLTRRLGYPPTLRELAAELAVTFQAVHDTAERCAAKGLLTWQPRLSRTIARAA